MDLSSPCFIDVGEHVPFPGLHVTQYVAMMKTKTGIDDVANPPAGATEEQTDRRRDRDPAPRQRRKLASDDGLKAVTSVSERRLSPRSRRTAPTRTASRRRCARMTRRTSAGSRCVRPRGRADPNLFEGTDRVLTEPLNGTTYGFVDSAQNPINFAPVGGAQFFVDETLDDFDGFAIYWQYDDANHDGKPDYPTGVPATRSQTSSARS